MKPHITRRSFLKSTTAGLVGGAFAAPTLLPRRVLGSPGEPGANERVVVGMIGLGIQGMGHHLRPFNRLCDVAAVCDVYAPHAQQAADQLNARRGDAPAVAIYEDYRHLLDRDDINAVVIATPQHWHALQCVHAAQARKDIYCEKPLTWSVQEGRYIAQAVEKYGVVLQTGSQQRSGRNEYRAISHVRNGTIGKITRVQASNYRSAQQNGHPGEDIPEGLNWDMWCGPARNRTSIGASGPMPATRLPAGAG